MFILKFICDKISTGNKRSVAVKKNIIGSLGLKTLSIVVSLMLVPLTLGYVSDELYGVWLTLSSIMVWMNFFDVGFTLGLKNKLAEAIAIEDWERGRKLVSTTYLMMVVIFVPLCLLLEVMLPLVNWSEFLNVSSQLEDPILTTLRILVVCFCFQMIVNVLSAVAAAFQKVALAASFPVVGNVLSLILIYILTKTAPPSLPILAYAISTTPVIVILVVSVVMYSKTFRRVSPSIRSIDLSYIKDLFNLGAKFFIIQIQVVVLYQCTNILISNVSGPEEVTAYNIAYKYTGISMMLFTILLAPLWPAFTDAFVKRDFSWMEAIYKKMTMVYLASVVLVVAMVAISPLAYHLWIGDDAYISWRMTIFVALYMIIYSWESLQVNMINGIGKVKLQSYLVIVGLLLNIPLSLFLGRYMGAIGVVLSMILINLIYAATFTVQIRKILKKKAAGVWFK